MNATRYTQRVSKRAIGDPRDGTVDQPAGGGSDDAAGGAATTINVLIGANTIYPTQQRQWFSDVSARFAKEMGRSYLEAEVVDGAKVHPGCE